MNVIGNVSYLRPLKLVILAINLYSMKLYTLSILLIFSFFCCTPSAKAGFWVKAQTTVVVSSSNKVAASPRNSLELTKHPNAVLAKNLPGHPDNSGWEGIVSLVCGILGLFTFYPAIPAIVFGILGLGHNKAHHGMALAGLIIGAVTVVLYALLIIALSGGLWF